MLGLGVGFIGILTNIIINAEYFNSILFYNVLIIVQIVSPISQYCYFGLQIATAKFSPKRVF